MLRSLCGIVSKLEADHRERISSELGASGPVLASMHCLGVVNESTGNNWLPLYGNPHVPYVCTLSARDAPRDSVAFAPQLAALIQMNSLTTLMMEALMMKIIISFPC